MTSAEPADRPRRAAPEKRRGKPSLRDQAYETIKRRIVICELAPGETVTLSDLANDLGIGRTPVIQAVDRLMVDGLLEVIPRKGIVVAPVPQDALAQIIEIRLLNEAQAVRWAAERASSADVGPFRTNLDATWAAARAGDIETMIGLDRAFHQLVSMASGNAVLTDLLGNLHDRSIRFWSISLRVPDHNIHVCEQHAAILDGILANDPDAAERAARAHIEAFQRNILTQLRRPAP